MGQLKIDGFENNYIFCMWPDSNKLPPARVTELFSILCNSHCPIIFLTKTSIKNWELPHAPFHPAVPYLSECNVSDYFRAYLIHYYGGGYTDIKFTYKSWKNAFEGLRDSDAYIAGYAFTRGEFGLSKKYAGTRILEEMKTTYEPYGIGNAAFISKKNTPFTAELLSRTNSMLDEKLEALKANPSRSPKDSLGMVFPDGSVSKYPLDYVELGPDLFHFTLSNHKDKVIHCDLQPLHVYHFDIKDENFIKQKKDFVGNFLPNWPFET